MPKDLLRTYARLSRSVDIFVFRAECDRDCVIDNGAHIAPGAHLAARVHVGRGSWVGIGSVVKAGVRIGKATVIGAGSLVLNDIPDDALADGSPARLVRSLPYG